MTRTGEQRAIAFPYSLRLLNQQPASPNKTPNVLLNFNFLQEASLFTIFTHNIYMSRHRRTLTVLLISTSSTRGWQGTKAAASLPPLGTGDNKGWRVLPVIPQLP